MGSYAWKSILSARDVIRRGMVWRVGTGERVRIKEDRWLPEKANSLVISPLTQVAAETKVSSLIDQDQVRWNEEVVQNLFLPHEDNLILAIPLSLRQPPDHIAWKHTPSGMFTTSSAYKLIVSCESKSNAGSSSEKAIRSSGGGYGNSGCQTK